jgi:membrane-associated phospholipid phosphatase
MKITTLRARWEKTALFLGVMVYYLAGYFVINQWTATRTVLYHLDLPFESALPIYPALIFAYILELVFFVLAYWMIDDLDFFKKTARAFLLLITFHFIVFVAFPVEYHLRPVIDPYRGWAYFLVYFYYWMDLPYNCFPSMHVSNVFLIAFILQKYRRGMGWILQPLAVLVAISVVLVKQHFIADVVAGFLVGWFVYEQIF